MSLRIGCIADDFTGATDVANNLVRAGMRVVQTVGLPSEQVGEAEAVVVALKSRTAPVDEAVSASIEAARWLLDHGAEVLYFKVCSTFDSTPQGNIGPVAEALCQLAGSSFVPVAPAFPVNGRTVFQGHLFVGDQLLSESAMRFHPLTPMTDAHLGRVLQAQLRRSTAGLVTHAHVGEGVASLLARATSLGQSGIRFGIVDTVDQGDLATLAQACALARWPLVVAGSGLALELPTALGLPRQDNADRLPAAQGSAAIVSGSCSATTNAQVAAFLAQGGEAFAVDGLRLAAGEQMATQAIEWALPRLGQRPVLVYATAQADTVKAVQQLLGADRAGALIEQTLADIARGLVQHGVRRLVVAGGETSGACVNALGIRQLRIGPQIDPGVPWCQAMPLGIRIALKSGNFGGKDFFQRAFEVS